MTRWLCVFPSLCVILVMFIGGYLFKCAFAKIETERELTENETAAGGLAVIAMIVSIPLGLAFAACLFL